MIKLHQFLVQITSVGTQSVNADKVRLLNENQGELADDIENMSDIWK